MRSMTRKNVKRATPSTKGDSSSRKKYRSRTASRGSLTALLYHRPVSRTSLVSLTILAHVVLVAAPVRATDPSDRLHPFLTLAATQATPADGTHPGTAGG